MDDDKSYETSLRDSDEDEDMVASFNDETPTSNDDCDKSESIHVSSDDEEQEQIAGVGTSSFRLSWLAQAPGSNDAWQRRRSDSSTESVRPAAVARTQASMRWTSTSKATRVGGEAFHACSADAPRRGGNMRVLLLW